MDSPTTLFYNKDIHSPFISFSPMSQRMQYRLYLQLLLLVCVAPLVPQASAESTLNFGGSHSLFLDQNGILWQWGNSTLMPTVRHELQDISSISTQGDYSAALLEDGSLVTWGNNETPDPSAATAQQIVSTSVGRGTSLALNQNGEVLQWDNDQPDLLSTVSISTPVVQVSSSEDHFLALDQSGLVWSWGGNGCGQLGRTTSAETDADLPTVIPTLEGITAIYTNNDRSNLALDQSGRLWGWGRNDSGELGLTSATSECIDTPEEITALPVVTRATIGPHHALAIDQDGAVWSWGGNFFHQLGQDVDQGDHFPPAQLSGLNHIVDLIAGGGHSAARDSEGTIWVWGGNWGGQLGLGHQQEVSSPTQLAGSWGVVDLAGTSNHKLFVSWDGTLHIQGSNHGGLFGTAAEILPYSDDPYAISGLPAVVRVESSNHHILALDDSGTIWSWGNNSQGQLGREADASSISPQSIAITTAVQDIATGNFHSMALDQEGTVWVWGDNQHGQLGMAAENQTQPQPLSMLPTIVSIAAGSYHSLALDEDGHIWNWGANWKGQLGRNASSTDPTPTQVNDLESVQLVTAYGDRSYLFTDSGQLIRWGAVSTVNTGTHSEQSSIQQLSIPATVDPLSSLTSLDQEHPLLSASGELGDEFRTPVDAIEKLGLDFVGGIWSGDRGFGDLINAERSLFLPHSQRHHITRHYQLSRGWNLVNINFAEDDHSTQTFHQSEIPYLLGRTTDSAGAPEWQLIPTDNNQSLSQQPPASGYWVNSQTARSFDISGMSDPPDYQHLEAGWNLITLLDGFSLQDLAAYIESQTGLTCERSYLYDAAVGWSVYDHQRNLEESPAERVEALLASGAAAAWILLSD